MSWYPKEETTCPKCGDRFNTPIDALEHRKRCCITRTDYPNGSRVVEHDDCPIGYIQAPNPFGGSWRMNFNGVRLFGAGYPSGIRRRGRMWHSHFVHGKGWEWR